MLRESVVLHESFLGIKAGPLGSLFFDQAYSQPDFEIIFGRRSLFSISKIILG